MLKRSAVIVLSATLAAFLILGAIATTARGEWPDNEFKNAHRWDEAPKRWRYVDGGWWHADHGWYADRRRYRYRARVTSDPLCLRHPWTVRGRPAYRERNARAHAIVAWQDQVQLMAGTRYAFIQHAKDAKYACGALTVEPVSRQVLQVCVVVATPCQPAGNKWTPIKGLNEDGKIRDDQKLED
jgi:hypothetical protein